MRIMPRPNVRTTTCNRLATRARQSPPTLYLPLHLDALKSPQSTSGARQRAESARASPRSSAAGDAPLVPGTSRGVELRQ